MSERGDSHKTTAFRLVQYRTSMKEKCRERVLHPGMEYLLSSHYQRRESIPVLRATQLGQG